MQKAPVCRWGILGAAEIARKNWQAIRRAPHATLVAVASRSVPRCRQFVDQCQEQVPFEPSPVVCGSYEELLASDRIDAVYLPLPTTVRKDWAIRAAQAGKHVLLEKPVAASVQDVREILAACRQNGVQFMDGVMFMHSRRLDRIREVLADGRSVGALKRITSQFADGEASAESFAGNIRARSELEPLGCLGDLGWYCIRFTLWAMNWALPVRVAGHMVDEYRHPASPAAIPTDFSGELFFAGGVSASFHCSFTAQIQQWAHLGGTLGALWVPDFVLPRNGGELSFDVSSPTFRIQGCDFVLEDPLRRFTVQEPSHGVENAQESNMFQRFSELVLSGRTDEFWGEAALKTQQVLEACLRSARSGGQVVALTD